MSENILVIGACGQLGTELVESLRTIYGDSNVVASDIRQSEHAVFKQGPFENLDILDKNRLSEILTKYQPKQVYHLAALLSATAEAKPKLGWTLNMDGLFNVLDAAVDFKIGKVYWPSSIAVFGPGTPVNHTPQNCVMDPNTIYGISKLAGERYCEYYFQKRNIKSIRKKESYAGGYLLDPKPGLYSDVSDLDFTSLYPSIIKSLNLGIETLMGRIVTKDNYEQYNSLEQLKKRNPEEIIHIQKLNRKTYVLKDANISLGNLIDLIETNKWTISASGAFYRTDVKSIACEVLQDWFDQRNHYRGLKSKAGKAEDWANYKLYDLYQMAFKILQK